MPSFKPKEVTSILHKLGFFQKRQTGSHLILFNPETKVTISVPMHKKDIGRGLLLAIAKQANSTEEEFIKLK